MAELYITQKPKLIDFRAFWKNGMRIPLSTLTTKKNQ